MVPPVLRASLLVGCVGGSLWLTGCGTSATEPANQKAAQALAQRLLGSVVLPASSRRLGRAPAPGLDRVPQKIDATTSVDRHSIWRVPLSEQALASFLQSHRPPGTSLVGTSSWVSRSESVDGLVLGLRPPPKGRQRSLAGGLLARPEPEELRRPDRHPGGLASGPYCGLTGAPLRSVGNDLGPKPGARGRQAFTYPQPG